MTYVDDAFAKCRTTLEITKTERDFASRKQNDIRDAVRAGWDLDEDFLTGSYRRETKTKKLKDVDMFVVIKPGGAQANLRKLHPSKVLSELEKLLKQVYDDVVSDGFACTVRFGADDEVASFDVVPAFKRKPNGWEIPDADRGRWIATDPKAHHDASTAKNKKCDGKFVPFVKMIKGINRHHEEPIQSSFLLEVMAHELVDDTFTRYQDEIVWFLASAAEQVTNGWPDPAGIGPDVNETVSVHDRQAAATAISGWMRTAQEAVYLEDQNRHRDAVEKWRELFGSRMPRP